VVYIVTTKFIKGLTRRSMQNQAQDPGPHDFTSRKHFLSVQQTVSYLSEMELPIHDYYLTNCCVFDCTYM